MQSYPGQKQVLTRIPFIAVALLLSLSRAGAQTDVDEVHIAPRVQLSKPSSPTSLTNVGGQTIQKRVELVLVPVTVFDESNRLVTGLEQENFQLYEDKRPQPIKHIWQEDEPVSVGIVLDVSGSMNNKIDRAREAVVTLLKASNPQDEFFLMTFADRPTLVQDFTQSAEDIQSKLLFVTPKGQTSLLDSLVMAVNHMNQGRYRRRALVVVSDGGDNRSRYTESEVKSLIKESDVLIYSVGIFESQFGTIEERLGPALLEDISGVTGASSYTLDNPNYLPKITQHIANQLRNQYVLAYSPDAARHDGKWRKIKVRLALPHGLPKLHVQARTGYYGPAQ